MNTDNIIKALELALDLVTAADTVAAHARSVIATAREQGRDISDAELAALTEQRHAAVEAFRQKVGG